MEPFKVDGKAQTFMHEFLKMDDAARWKIKNGKIKHL